MPGVTSVTDSNCFLGCHVLETLVIGNGLYVNAGNGAFNQSWNNGSYTAPKMTIYTTSTTDIKVTFNHPTNDNAWNGTVVYYDAELSAPNTWRWAADGTIEVYSAQ
jgi:hypothetical protein